MTNHASSRRRGVVLVGHGGVPKDFPRERLTRLKALEAQRRGSGRGPSPEEVELERAIRTWPRTPETDPYQAGLEALAAALAPLLDGARFALAYNEFCAPCVEEAVEGLIAAGATEITVVPSMLTPGGSHAQEEIPAMLAQLQARYPGVVIRYAWPFDLADVARLLAQQVARFERSGWPAAQNRVTLEK
ncbi:sirohydrochlorin chelatase [Nitrospira sp. Kam-Ns4a]